jgi:hypothetical protein
METDFVEIQISQQDSQQVSQQVSLQISTLKTDLSELKAQMESINIKLDQILALQTTDCKKMSDHIVFVEKVYENVKTPFNYIMNAVNKTLTITDTE